MNEYTIEITRELVVHKVRHLFPKQDASTIMSILDEYGTESYHQKRERVQLAILKLSGGDLRQLRLYTEAAKDDYRDVLCWAEYLRQFQLHTSSSREELAQAKEADRREYLDWLESTSEE